MEIEIDFNKEQDIIESARELLAIAGDFASEAKTCRDTVRYTDYTGDDETMQAAYEATNLAQNRLADVMVGTARIIRHQVTDVLMKKYAAERQPTTPSPVPPKSGAPTHIRTQAPETTN